MRVSLKIAALFVFLTTTIFLVVSVSDDDYYSYRDVRDVVNSPVLNELVVLEGFIVHSGKKDEFEVSAYNAQLSVYYPEFEKDLAEVRGLIEVYGIVRIDNENPILEVTQIRTESGDIYIPDS